MLKKGKQFTLKKLLNVITNKDNLLLGARYENSTLAVDVPITTTFEGIEIDPQKETVAGTISFRPVGERQTNALAMLKDSCEAFGGYGEFLDATIEKPLLNSDYAVDVSLADSVFSNLQEIPFNIYMSSPKVYCSTVTIKGRVHTQYTLEDMTADGIVSSLILVFRAKKYDGETLLGAYKNKPLTKTEGLKLLQFIANGSVLEQVVGAVSILGKEVGTTLFPMFDDVTMRFTLLKEVPWVNISCDTGTVAFREADIRSISIDSARPTEFKVSIKLATETVTLLIG